VIAQWLPCVIRNTNTENYRHLVAFHQTGLNVEEEQEQEQQEQEQEQQSNH
jgi:hypothetical protein